MCARLFIKIGLTLLMAALVRGIEQKTRKRPIEGKAEEPPSKPAKSPPTEKKIAPDERLQKSTTAPKTKTPGTPDDLSTTIDRIERGEKYPHRNDGSIFKNKEGRLPAKPTGYYKEYVHPTGDMVGPGPQRLVIGSGGEIYYTPDHYATFIPLQ